MIWISTNYSLLYHLSYWSELMNSIAFYPTCRSGVGLLICIFLSSLYKCCACYTQQFWLWNGLLKLDVLYVFLCKNTHSFCALHVHDMCTCMAFAYYLTCLPNSSIWTFLSHWFNMPHSMMASYKILISLSNELNTQIYKFILTVCLFTENEASS